MSAARIREAHRIRCRAVFDRLYKMSLSPLSAKHPTANAWAKLAHSLSDDALAALFNDEELKNIEEQVAIQEACRLEIA